MAKSASTIRRADVMSFLLSGLDGRRAFSSEVDAGSREENALIQ
jgi:hypothetical protein